MKLATLLATCALAACSKTFDFDVIVGANGVGVATANADLDCDCEGNEWPTVGYCIPAWTDVKTNGGCSRASCSSCIDSLAIEIDGTRVASGSVEASAITFADAVGPGRVLVISGCGHGTVRVPLDVEPYATPTLTVSGDTVQWTADVPIVASWIAAGNLFSGENCVVDDRMSWSVGGTNPVFTVQTFGAIPEYKTALGTARVWSGGTATMK